MSTSQRTFEQVKSILGKLDRDIDAARQKRLQLRTGSPVPATTSSPVAPPAAAPSMAAPLSTPRPLATPGASGFGRATPMRLEHRTTPAPNRP